MNYRKNIFIYAALLFLSSAASGEESSGNIPRQAIAGHITSSEGEPLQGVRVRLTGDAVRSAVTDSGGRYHLDIPENAGITISPAALNYRFEPGYSEVNEPGEINFTGFVNHYSISGKLIDSRGRPISNGRVTLSGSGESMTVEAQDGFYRFENIPGDKNYEMTVSAEHYTFEPSGVSVQRLSGDIVRDFSGTGNSYHIRGRIEDGGFPLEGVRVVISEGTNAARVTGPDGKYEFRGLAPGKAYAVSAEKKSFAIFPEKRSTASLEGDIEDYGFSGSKHTFFIKGYVRESSGRGIGGVALRLSGDVRVETVTSIDGFYEFMDLPANGRYAISPVKKNHRFSPGRRTVSALAGHITGLNFSGRETLRRFSLRGYINDTDGNPVDDVRLVIISDRLPLHTRTSKEGDINIPLIENGYYTIEPVKDGYSFEPEVLSITGVLTDIKDFLFTAHPADSPGENYFIQKNSILVVGSAAGRGTVSPASGEGVRVYYYGESPGKFYIRIFTMSGQLVWQESLENSNSRGVFEWPARGVSSGTYIAHVSGPGLQQTGKFVVLK